MTELRTEMEQRTKEASQDIRTTTLVQTPTTTRSMDKGKDIASTPSSSTLQTSLASPSITGDITKLMKEDTDAKSFMQLSAFAFTKTIEQSEKETINTQKVLELALERLQKTLPSPVQLEGQNIEKNLEKVIEEFDAHFSTLEESMKVKVQADNEAKLFHQVCENIRNSARIAGFK